MTPLISSSGNIFHEIQDTLSLTTEWMSHLVSKIKPALPYLQDPRIASGFIFAANFGILELSYRVTQLAGLCLSKEVVDQEEEVLSTSQTVVVIGLTCAANLVLVRAADISLHPIAIVASIISSSIVKFTMQAFIEN